MSTATTFAGLRPLIVDDDRFMRVFALRMLQKLGIDEAAEAVDGQSALDALNSGSTFDFVMCDLNMPGMDGVELLRHLGELPTCPPLILVSGEDKRVLDTARQLAEAHSLRVLGVVEKPAKPSQLAALLNEVLESRGDDQAVARAALQVLTPGQIREGLMGGALRTVYQPKVEITTGQVRSVETLSRWDGPDGRFGPAAFIPVAEEHGLVGQITEQVIRQALSDAAIWSQQGLDIDVAINVSMLDLAELGLLDMICNAAASAGVDPRRVIIEVTESRIMNDVAAPLENLARLRMKGVGLSIDDFGTGASSMEQLKRIPFTELKIDRAFVHNADNDPEVRTMLESSVELAQRLNLHTVAEGVETQAEWNVVASLGVDLVQGYFIAKPMPADELLSWAIARNTTHGP